jgi:hypothetical protein
MARAVEPGIAPGRPTATPFLRSRTRQLRGKGGDDNAGKEEGKEGQEEVTLLALW